MSQSIEFQADGMIELVAALPRAASDLARLFVALKRLQAKAEVVQRTLTRSPGVAAREFRDVDHGKLHSDAHAVLERILSAQGGADLREMEEARANRPELNPDALFDPEFNSSVIEVARGAVGIDPAAPLPAAPGRIVERALASLQQSAAMMREIVEETRRDHIEFDIRRRQIDRTLARIDETLEKAIGLS